MMSVRRAGSWPDSRQRSSEEERALKRFLYTRLYNAAELVPVRTEAQRVVADLFAAYRDNPSLLPVDWRSEEDEIQRLRPSGTSLQG